MKRGFTITELSVIITITVFITILVFITLNPDSRFKEAKNNARREDINSILAAIHEYSSENEGSLPQGLKTGMPETQLGLCSSGGATLCASATEVCVNLNTSLAKYLKNIPVDLSYGTADTTGYSVWVDSNNIVTVSACVTENNEKIIISR